MFSLINITQYIEFVNSFHREFRIGRRRNEPGTHMLSPETHPAAMVPRPHEAEIVLIQVGEHGDGTVHSDEKGVSLTRQDLRAIIAKHYGPALQRRASWCGATGAIAVRIGLNGAFWGLDTTGSGQYLHHLLPALANLGPDAELSLFLPQYLALGNPELRAPCAVHPIRTPFDTWHKNLAKLWHEQIAYPDACWRAGVDIAHVPYFAPPLRCMVPVVVTIHDLIPLVLSGYRGSLGVRGYMHLVSRAARCAAMVLTDSRASARDIEHLLHIPPERIRVIYLAVDACYRPLALWERQATLERLRVPPRYLLYLGGFDQRKNVSGILRAFARARERLGGTTLVIAGKLPAHDSAFTPDPHCLAKELKLEDRVHYTGWVAEEDKPALYSGAMAFLFPSYYEGFGLPVLEAISCGTPAVVGAGSSLEEIAGPGGLATPPADGEALTQALVALVEQPSLRQELAQRGLLHAQRFSWQETARQTLEAYREVLERQ